MKKSMFEIIQNIPYCSNCGKLNWKKDKKGILYCVYCGHPMIIEKYKKEEQDNKKFKIGGCDSYE